MKKDIILEHRQTLRACTFIVICKLKLKIDNLKLEMRNLGEKLEIWVGKVGNFEEKKWQIWEKMETWKNCKFGKRWKPGNLERIRHFEKT